MTNTTAAPVNEQTLKNLPANVQGPGYDRNALKEGILHIGVGGFHRSHQALYLDDLIGGGESGADQWAICGVGIMPQDKAMHDALTKQDCLYTLVERIGDKSTARVIGSLKNYIFGFENPEEVFAKIANPAIKIVTLTATEGGYCFNQLTGKLDLDNAGVKHDLSDPLKPRTIFGYLTEGLKRRKAANAGPITILSCDNLQGNGHVAESTLLAFCSQNNADLVPWIKANVKFPNCMVDRITPVTTDAEKTLVRDVYHLEDKFPVVAEPFKQWVVEDKFAAGRPALEKVGVQFTDDVAPYEKMKIRLLNATHSAMGYLGYLCGYRYIYEIAQAPEFIPYLKAMMDQEVTPLIANVPGINLDEYKTSLMERFGNESIKDQALRICMDGSSKMPKFILPSIEEEIERKGPYTRLALCVASWIRFLNGKDEAGQEIPLQDPQAERLREVAQGQGGRDVRNFLAMEDIFGNLGKNADFVAHLQKLVDHLYDKGARATLDAVVAGSIN
jgi:mannitol 2-dehydrogenase